MIIHCIPKGIFQIEALYIVMKIVIPILIGVLALVGFADSMYMTLAHYDVIDAQSLSDSNICTLTDGACEKTLSSSDATTLGIPNAVLGAGYFAAVIGFVSLRLIMGKWIASIPTFAFLIAGFGFSVYLTHQLIFQMHEPCPFCLAAHTVNAFVLGLFAISAHP